MTELRNAIADILAASDGRPVDTWHEENADAIIAMPEMQAIRRWLRNDWGNWCCDVCRSEFLDELNVPASVRAWVAASD